MEFSRELTNHFSHWCMASDVDNFESLCNLVLLEQFKNSLPSQVATYINERKVTTVAEAAALADEYVLIHKHRPSEFLPGPVVKKEGGRRLLGRLGVFSGKGENLCNYCPEAGHWKADCLMLRAKKQYAGGGWVKPAALAASIPGSVNVGVWQGGNADLCMAGVLDESYLPFVT